MASHPFTSLTVLNNWVFYFGWDCWESPLPPATSEPNSFIQMFLRKSSEYVEVTHTLSRTVQPQLRIGVKASFFHFSHFSIF